MSLVPLTDADRKAFRSVCGINLPTWYPERDEVERCWIAKRAADLAYLRAQANARRARQSQADAGR